MTNRQDVISEREVGSQVPLVAGVDEERYNCLFCDDTKHHLYVNRSKGVFHCFKCNAKGIFQKEESERYLDNLQKRKVNVTIEEKTKIVKNLPRNSKLERVNTEEEFPYLEYLEKRGLTIGEVLKNDLRYSLDKHGLFANSIIFPVWQRYPKWLSPDHDPSEVEILDYFVCRKLEGHQKYVNAPWEKGATLYRPYCPVVSKTLVICEGVFDAIRIARVSPVVALLGKTATKQQLQKLTDLALSTHVERLVVMLDADAEIYGMRLRLDLSARYKFYRGVRQAKLSQKDPGDSTVEEIKEALDYADF